MKLTKKEHDLIIDSLKSELLRTYDYVLGKLIKKLEEEPPIVPFETYIKYNEHYENRMTTQDRLIVKNAYKTGLEGL